MAHISEEAAFFYFYLKRLVDRYLLIFLPLLCGACGFISLFNIPIAPLVFDIPFIYKDDAPLALLSVCHFYSSVT